MLKSQLKNLFKVILLVEIFLSTELIHHGNLTSLLNRSIASRDQSYNTCLVAVSDLLKHSDNLDSGYLDEKIKNADLARFLIHEEDDFFTASNELSDVYEYTTSVGFKKYNSGYNKKPIRDLALLRNRERLSKSMKSFPEYDGLAFSGTVLTDELFKKLNFYEGKIIQYDYFLSSSRSFKVAEKFSQRDQIKYYLKGKSHRIIFKIQSITGRYIGTKSAYSDQEEVLFDYATKFRIGKIEEVENVLYISMEEIQIQKNQLIKFFSNEVKNIKLVNEIDSNRFIAAVEQAPVPSHLKYGKETWSDWVNGVSFIKTKINSNQLNTQLLKDIHFITSEHMPFNGDYKRSIRDIYRSGEISKYEAIKAINKFETDKNNHLDNQAFRGIFRKQEIFIHNGDSFTKEGHMYFMAQELEGFMKNPYFNVDLKSIKIVNNEVIFADVYYLHPELIEDTVDKVLTKADARLNTPAITTREYIETIVLLEKALISIHPFLDGNGRAIRLLCDLLYQRRGLPVPIRPIEDDMTAGVDEMVEKTIHNMNEYVLKHRVYKK